VQVVVVVLVIAEVVQLLAQVEQVVVAVVLYLAQELLEHKTRAAVVGQVV
jgi:hypothetical protein